MQNFASAVMAIASVALAKQGRSFTPPDKSFSLLMPSPEVATQQVVYQEGLFQAAGECFSSSDGTCRVLASRWQCNQKSSTTKMKVFIQSLVRTFPDASKSIVETALHGRQVGTAKGGYITMSSGQYMIGLWLTVQSQNTIYTVSFSTTKANFAKVENIYLNSFQLPMPR